MRLHYMGSIYYTATNQLCVRLGSLLGYTVGEKTMLIPNSRHGSSQHSAWCIRWLSTAVDCNCTQFFHHSAMCLLPCCFCPITPCHSVPYLRTMAPRKGNKNDMITVVEMWPCGEETVYIHPQGNGNYKKGGGGESFCSHTTYVQHL